MLRLVHQRPAGPCSAAWPSCSWLLWASMWPEDASGREEPSQHGVCTPAPLLILPVFTRPSWRFLGGKMCCTGNYAVEICGVLKNASQCETLVTAENIFYFYLKTTVFSPVPTGTCYVSCVIPELCLFQELRKPSYAEICQRTSRDAPSSPLQPPKEQKPNASGCGKGEKQLTEREPPAPKASPGPARDPRRPAGPTVGKRPHREQSTPPRSPQ